jgi:hypothetical protein
MTSRKPGRPKGSGTRPLAERFAKFVQRGGPDECWLWIGSTSKDGHGRVWDGQTVIPAHHGAYILVHGERPPPGVYLRRTCENKKLCMNPAHFKLCVTERKEDVGT